MERLTDWLGQCPLVAILRGVTPPEIEAIGDALLDAGVVIIEVPLNSPEPIESIKRLAHHFGTRALVGAGTVMRAEQVEDVKGAGGRLVVTPHAGISVVRSARQAGLVAVPGFFTVTEAFSAIDAGAEALKLFPAEATMPAALSAMRAVLPRETIVLPMGGIGADTMEPWVKAGAHGFGVGSAIYRPGDNAATVSAKAKSLVAAIDRLTRTR